MAYCKIEILLDYTGIQWIYYIFRYISKILEKFYKIQNKSNKVNLN